MVRKYRIGVFLFVLFCGFSFSDIGYAASGRIDSGDTAWMLVSTVLVFFMIPGLGFFYAGMVREKNALSSIMHSMVAIGLIGVQWMAVGYSLVFGGEGNLIGGLSNIFLHGIDYSSVTEQIPTYVYVWFQGAFAMLTPALISGAIAERVKFGTYCLFVLLWSFVVYDPVAHWVWGGGWLQKMGALDFAGGTVVHLASGCSALAVIAVLGNRTGFPRNYFLPHNLTMTLLGASILWVGWFGFNAGSALGANGLASLAVCTTLVASASSALSWMFMEWYVLKKPSGLGYVSGAVAGLVAITPAAGFVTPFWAMVMGAVAGVLCYYGVRIKFRFGFDDSLDVIGIHGIGGAFGAVATGIFATENARGLILGSFSQFWVQIVGVVVVGIYSYTITYILARLLNVIASFRVDAETEVNGLDRELHGESAYHLFESSKM